MSWPKAGVMPYLVFLIACVVYVAFPSNHFNADALHYNLLAFMSLYDPSVVLRDGVVAAHLLWHLLASIFLFITQPATPLESLYLLRLMNIVLALGSIFLFMGLVRASAGAWAAAWATVILAFSQACLRHFLAVEVYSLNNLVLILILMAVHRATLAELRPGAGRAAAFAVLSAVAIGTHLANVLLVIPMLLFLLWRGREKRRVAAGVYLLCLFVLAVSGVVALALLSGRDLAGTLSYLMSYAGVKTNYLSSDILRNMTVSCWSVPASIMDRFTLWLYIPAAFFVWIAARHWSIVWKDHWARFLLIQLALMGALVTQWDPENMEHKIACIPVALLLVTRVQALVAPRPRGSLLAASGLIAATVLACGLIFGVRPYTRLEGYEPYRQSSQIRRQSTGDSVVLILSPGQTAESVTLASMTFFKQHVVVLDETQPGTAAQVESLRDRGFEVLRAAE